MEDDRRDTIGRIFAIATERIEAAHEIAVDGQHPDQDPATARAVAARLRVIAGEIVTLADAAAVLAGDCADEPVHPEPRKSL